MIKKVRLKNWKSHLDSEFDFSEGVNALVGINGAGKSSVLDGICFALFGTFPNHTNRKVDLDDLIMGRPAEKDGAEVTVDFEIGGKSYSVFRRIERGKGTVQAEARQDGSLVEVNPNGVTAFIEGALQMDYPMFSKAVYSEQNNIDFFLTIPKGRRMQHIDRMLRLDRFESVRSAAVSLKGSVEIRKRERLRILFESDKDGLTRSMGKAKADIENLKASISALDLDLAFAKAEKEKAAGVVKEFEGRNKRLAELDRFLEGARAAGKEIAANIEERLRAIDNMDRATLLKAVEAMEKEAAIAWKCLAEKKDAMEKLRDRLSGINSEIIAATKGMDALEKAGGAACPVCDSPLPEEKKGILLNTRKAAINGLRGRAGQTAMEIESLKKDMVGMERSLENSRGNVGRLKSGEKEFEIIERLGSKAKILELDVKKFQIERAEIESGMGGIDIKSLSIDFEAKVKRIGELESRRDAMDELLADKENFLLDMSRKLELIGTYEQDIHVCGLMMKQLDQFIESVKLTQEQLREEFTKTVNSIMGKVWKSIYPHSDYTDVRLVVDGDYILQLKVAGTDTWMPVDGFASGGERSLACLSLRIAFSLAFIPNLRWLILDEPTHNLDAETIRRFSSILRENVGKAVSQIFLITHENRMVEDIEGPVYRLERDKSANGVTKTSCM